MTDIRHVFGPAAGKGDFLHTGRRPHLPSRTPPGEGGTPDRGWDTYFKEIVLVKKANTAGTAIPVGTEFPWSYKHMIEVDAAKAAWRMWAWEWERAGEHRDDWGIKHE